MTTTEDVIKSAAAVARDAAEGRLDPATLDQLIVDESRELFGAVAGPPDPLWPLHLDVTRQVLALGGVPAAELSEWAAVGQRREQRVEAVETSEPADRHTNPSEAETSASGSHSLGNGSPDGEPET